MTEFTEINYPCGCSYRTFWDIDDERTSAVSYDRDMHLCKRHEKQFVRHRDSLLKKQPFDVGLHLRSP